MGQKKKESSIKRRPNQQEIENHIRSSINNAEEKADNVEEYYEEVGEDHIINFQGDFPPKQFIVALREYSNPKEANTRKQ